MTDKTPNPGSDEAHRAGCTCARVDNGFGRGYMGGMKNVRGETMFVITESCPLHWGAPCPVVPDDWDGEPSRPCTLPYPHPGRPHTFEIEKP